MEERDSRTIPVTTLSQACQRHYQRPSRCLQPEVSDHPSAFVFPNLGTAHCLISPRLGQECQPFKWEPPAKGLFTPENILIVSNGRYDHLLLTVVRETNFRPPFMTLGVRALALYSVSVHVYPKQ